MMYKKLAVSTCVLCHRHRHKSSASSAPLSSSSSSAAQPAGADCSSPRALRGQCHNDWHVVSMVGWPLHDTDTFHEIPFPFPSAAASLHLLPPDLFIARSSGLIL